MRKAKFILLIVGALVLLAFLIQNDQAIDVRMAWMTQQTPLAVLSLALLIIGFIAGAAVAVAMLSPSQEGDRHHAKTRSGTDKSEAR